ncbi:hypothetical protein PVIIG_06245 [Plasmodium vivax India VII]|uniref:VIR protein n=1 Tax=Plasmodium vivax India VII TaxID=1077284 RepID=A0A0J9S4R7_PLAVI|nr:hypothetical protein PVIIG_06245 [Plasmodium vivax India VII]
MNTLYNLYDKFTALYPNIKSIPDCKNLSAFVFLLNDYVKVINNNKSIILKNKLNEFINEIKKHKWATNEVCENKLSHVTPLKPDPPVETKVIISPNPGSPLQSTSISSSDSQSVSDDERSLHTNGLESLKTQSPSGKELAKDTMSHNGPLLSTETQENSVTLHTTEKVQSREALQPTGLISPRTRKSTLEAEYAQQKEYIGNTFPSKRQPYPAVSVQQGVLEIPNIENDTLEEKGYLRTVTDAVSGFMKDVEPAPILGVSGGMGALFLLFKVFIVLKIYL